MLVFFLSPLEFQSTLTVIDLPAGGGTHTLPPFHLDLAFCLPTVACYLVSTSDVIPPFGQVTSALFTLRRRTETAVALFS